MSGQVRCTLSTPVSWLIAGLTCLALTACHRQLEQHAQWLVFGTLVEVKLWGATAEEAETAFAGLQRRFQEMHEDLHAWEPGLLTEINKAFAQGQAARSNQQVNALLRRSQEYERLSVGRFNPAIGAVIEAWGFHTSEFPILAPPPERGRVESILMQSPSTLDIRIDGEYVESSNPAVQLDFGGIAKGYAVDLAIEFLNARGIEHAMVNAGGDLRAMDQRGGRSWRVAVRRPKGGIVGTVEVRDDEAFFTSGNYERFKQDGDQRFPHILDPRTGWAVEGLASVTVVSATGLHADAAATALVVAGPDDWPEVAGALGVESVLVIDEDGEIYLTPAMAERVQWVEQVHPKMVRTVP